MIRPKKSLGQNFLIDKKILKLIASSALINGQTILEVGPGTGNLTNFILNSKPKKFYVIEKDKNLSENLKNKFNDKLVVINKDILDVNENFLSDEKLKVFGNLPYNISTEILSKWINVSERSC